MIKNKEKIQAGGTLHKEARKTGSASNAAA